MKMPYSPLQIMSMISDERKRQDQKWGEQNHLNPVWLTILGEEYGEVAKAMLEKKEKEVVTELVQCAAVIVAWIEAIGRRDV